MIPFGIFLDHFTSHYCSNVCFGARLSVPLCRERSFPQLVHSYVSPQYVTGTSQNPWHVPEVLGWPKHVSHCSGLAGAMWSSQENMGTVLKWRGHACLKWCDDLFLALEDRCYAQTRAQCYQVFRFFKRIQIPRYLYENFQILMVASYTP